MYYKFDPVNKEQIANKGQVGGVAIKNQELYVYDFAIRDLLSVPI